MLFFNSFLKIFKFGFNNFYDYLFFNNFFKIFNIFYCLLFIYFFIIKKNCFVNFVIIFKIISFKTDLEISTL